MLCCFMLPSILKRRGSELDPLVVTVCMYMHKCCYNCVGDRLCSELVAYTEKQKFFEAKDFGICIVYLVRNNCSTLVCFNCYGNLSDLCLFAVIIV